MTPLANIIDDALAPQLEATNFRGVELLPAARELRHRGHRYRRRARAIVPVFRLARMTSEDPAHGSCCQCSARFTGREMALRARPFVEIVGRIDNDLRAEATPARTSPVDAFAFECGLSDAEIFGSLRSALVAHVVEPFSGVRRRTMRAEDDRPDTAICDDEYKSRVQIPHYQQPDKGCT